MSKFTGSFIKEQLKVMDDYEGALCNHPIPDKKLRAKCDKDFEAGQLAAVHNYADALKEIARLRAKSNYYERNASEAENLIDKLFEVGDKLLLLAEMLINENIGPLREWRTLAEEWSKLGGEG